MSETARIRPLAAADVAAVAQMFQRQFRGGEAPHNADLVAYLDRLFISGAFANPATPSLVHERPDGVLSGFLGVTAQPMQLDGRRIEVAVCGALMVEGRQSDPLAGPRLLKTFLEGDQDIALSETAIPVTRTMWRRLGGQLLPRHSLDWLRVIRPGSLAVETLARRIGPARTLYPLARLAERGLRQRQGARWASFPDDFKLAGGVGLDAVPLTQFLDYAREYTEALPIQRLWGQAALAQLAEDLPQKSQRGNLRTALVHRRGQPLGAFAYYHRPGHTAHVLDVLAGPEQAGAVIDALLVDATAMGAVAVRGRTNPAIFDALPERNCLLFDGGASVVAGKDKALVERFKRGDAAFNGLVGERWSRLEGDGFD